MRSYSDRKSSKGLEINILAFLKELSRKLWLVAIIGLVGAAIGGVIGEATKVETYSSTVSFVVNSATESGQTSSGEINAQINMAGTFSYILSSRALKTAVVEKCPEKVSYGTVDGELVDKFISNTDDIVYSGIVTGIPAGHTDDILVARPYIKYSGNDTVYYGTAREASLDQVKALLSGGN